MSLPQLFTITSPLNVTEDERNVELLCDAALMTGLLFGGVSTGLKY